MSEPSFVPYLSVVVTSRNDNHGGTLTRRMQTFVNALVAQCRRHDVPTELIFVEWNPPADKPKLVEALRWPKEMAPCQVRIIEVPPAIHARYQHAQSLPLYQFIAKNVGIRRARGEFVLATNIDVLLNHELMAFIAQRKLEKGKMYRIDRHDVETFVPEEAPIDEMLDYCATHLLRVNAREGTYPVTPIGLRLAEPVDIVAQGGGITLGAGWFDAIQKAGTVFRFAGETCDLRIEGASAGAHLLIDLRPGPGLGDRPFTLVAQQMGETTRELGRIVVMARETVSIPLPENEGKPVRMRLEFQGQRVELPGDPRALQVWVYSISIGAKTDSQPAAADVFPTTQGVAAGRGWGGAERYESGNVRWLLNDAEIWFNAAANQRRFAVLDLEPGPGVGSRPFVLRVLDESGKEIQSSLVMRRQRVVVPIDFAAGRLGKITLRAAATAPAQSDSPLKALLRQVELTDAPLDLEISNDVFPAGIPVAAGHGWYGAESRAGAKIRWLDDGGEIWYSLADDDPRRHIVLDLEPGPALQYRPCRVNVFDHDGNEIASTVLMGRQRVAIPVASTGGNLHCVAVHIDGEKIQAPDGRRLSALLTHVELSEAPPGRSATAHDVFPAEDGLAAGNGWYPLEQLNGRSIRWLANDAEIWFAAPAGQAQPITRYLLLHLEPGPAVKRKPFVLWGVDENGEEFFSTVVTSRRPVVIPVEFRPGRLSHFTIHLEAGMVEANGVLLSAMLTKVEIMDEPPALEDIAPPYIAFGAGWYGTERDKDKMVRWLAGVGEMLIDARRLSSVPREIKIDLDPGPSAGRKLDLTIRDETGAVLYRGELTRRQTIAVPLPLRRSMRLFFDPGTKGATAPDGRMLIALARDIRLVDQQGKEPAAQAAVARAGENTKAASHESARPAGGAARAASLAEAMVPSPHAEIVAPVYLHNNACGDFTMMHRDHWFEIRGHAEWDAFSIHLDSLLCFCAHHSGAVETMLEEPMRCYHIEHSVGSGWTPEGMDRLLRRIRLAGIRDVDWREVGQIGVILRRYNSPVSFSPSDWGLVKDELRQTVIG